MTFALDALALLAAFKANQFGKSPWKFRGRRAFRAFSFQLLGGAHLW